MQSHRCWQRKCLSAFLIVHSEKRQRAPKNRVIMIELTNIEKIAEEALTSERGETEGKAKFAAYISAREILVREVLPEIKGVQPLLTDHGPIHIADVLKRTEWLLGKKEEILKSFTGTELYCLLLCILFHDVGNIFDRRDHQRRITTVYDYVRPEEQRKKDEKTIVLTAVGAHCGEAADGSMDTLKDVAESSHLDGRPVKLRKIAAVLRFADELAEGPQRTSGFMQWQRNNSDERGIYHEYASITDVFIDRGNERIALTYHIRINTEKEGPFDSDKERKLGALLEFAYKRVIKLNQERQYSRYYCELIAPFKMTTVVFNFWINGITADMGIPEAKLTDIVVPGDSHKRLQEYDPSYEVGTIMAKLRDQCKVGPQPDAPRATSPGKRKGFGERVLDFLRRGRR